MAVSGSKLQTTMLCVPFAHAGLRHQFSYYKYGMSGQTFKIRLAGQHFNIKVNGQKQYTTNP